MYYVVGFKAPKYMPFPSNMTATLRCAILQDCARVLSVAWEWADPEECILWKEPGTVGYGVWELLDL